MRASFGIVVSRRDQYLVIIGTGNLSSGKIIFLACVAHVFPCAVVPCVPWLSLFSPDVLPTICALALTSADGRLFS